MALKVIICQFFIVASVGMAVAFTFKLKLLTSHVTTDTGMVSSLMVINAFKSDGSRENSLFAAPNPLSKLPVLPILVCTLPI